MRNRNREKENKRRTEKLNHTACRGFLLCSDEGKGTCDFHAGGAGGEGRIKVDSPGTSE